MRVGAGAGWRGSALQMGRGAAASAAATAHRAAREMGAGVSGFDVARRVILIGCCRQSEDEGATSRSAE